MELDSAQIVIVGIIVARLLVPLAIIRFPLPGILACLVLDAVDQTVFQAWRRAPTWPATRATTRRSTSTTSSSPTRPPCATGPTASP